MVGGEINTKMWNNFFKICCLIRYRAVHRNWYSKHLCTASKHYPLLSGYAHIYHRTSWLWAIQDQESDAKINYTLSMQKRSIPPLLVHTHKPNTIKIQSVVVICITFIQLSIYLLHKFSHTKSRQLIWKYFTWKWYAFKWRNSLKSNLPFVLY